MTLVMERPPRDDEEDLDQKPMSVWERLYHKGVAAAAYAIADRPRSSSADPPASSPTVTATAPASTPTATATTPTTGKGKDCGTCSKEADKLRAAKAARAQRRAQVGAQAVKL